MASGKIHSVIKLFQRKLVYPDENLEESNLKRCMTRLDLVYLGLGSTLGVGVYVLMGAVAHKYAGPSIVLSFLMAFVAALFAGFCFAEFGSRVPRSGSAYVYTYVTIGELMAFFIGWNVVLEGVFGAASVARGLSVYVDSMVDGAMSNWFLEVVPLPESFMSPYFDLFSFTCIVSLGILLAVGARESSLVNNSFSLLNCVVILFVIIAGAFKSDPGNWDIPAAEVPKGHGVGGFFPYGFWGTLQGTTLCFYAFTGFDAINATGEEVLDPRKAIPQAIVAVLLITFLVYACVSTVITMMMPYYLLDNAAATALAFRYVGWDWARWLVSCGAVAGIFASVYGCLFPLTRLLYAMASDGVFLRCFAYVNNKTKTPLISTLVTTIVVATLAAILNLEELILMMALGTLCSYTIVAACVLLLRYKAEPKPGGSYLKQAFGCGDRHVTKTTTNIVRWCMFLYVIICVLIAVFIFHVKSFNTLSLVIGLNAIALLLLIVITLQPQAKEHLKFKTPLVPIIPCVTVYANIHLMVLVKRGTWIRFFIWMAIGFPIYFISLWCSQNRNSNSASKEHENQSNGKANSNVTTVLHIESLTPPNTFNNNTISDHDHKNDSKVTDNKETVVTLPITALKTVEIIIQQTIVENNEEKEAKIIDLLDQVLQAEEATYEEKMELKEKTPVEDIMTPIESSESIRHRKSLSNLSDAGSETSFNNQDTKYNVIAQVHREDMPIVSEEEEKTDNEHIYDTMNENCDAVRNKPEFEQVTSFNDSETNSRTDESGYSDTLDRNGLNDSIEDTREEASRIPTPPPMDATFFNTPYFLQKSYTTPTRSNKQKPAEENKDEECKPRESIQSNTSLGTDDGNITFGSSRQMKFMIKLNDIFQHKMASDNSGEEKLKRSNSTGDVRKSGEIEQLNSLTMHDRPSLFFDMKKELAAMSVPNLRSVRNEDCEKLNNTEPIIIEDEDATTEDSSLSKEDLKSKLETIFASGGPRLLKPRLMKSNPPTPEEGYQNNSSSSESITKFPKIEKNDTLKRQKDKFGDVLNSIRLNFKDDAV